MRRISAVGGLLVGSIEPRRAVYLETSSYLPLIWRTPYSRSVVEEMSARAADSDFYLQRDCIAEAAGYLSFEDNWKYHPAVRIRRLLQRTPDEDLRTFGFPSAAVQLLLGGNIWPQAQYLNFVRHTAFFFLDLLDHISWSNPREGMTEFASRIEAHVLGFRRMCRDHTGAAHLMLPCPDILAYWGRWYLSQVPSPFRITVLDDPRPYHMTADKYRDYYHYDSAAAAHPKADLMLVANTGFARNVKNMLAELPYPILCARTCSTEFFADKEER
jgi:hypothetical protein